MFVFIITVINFILCSAFAANLHVVLAIDTQAENVEEGKVTDKKVLTAWVKEVAAATELKLKLHPLPEGELTSEKIGQLIKKLKVGSQDTLLCFLGGHGGIPEGSNSQWPNVMFTGSHHSISMKGVINQLRKKHPRLLIVANDSCSSPYPEWWYPPLPSIKSKSTTAGYRALFRDKKGELFITGAQPGTYAYVLFANGGAFTQSFVWAAKMVAAKGDTANWDEVLNQTQTHIDSLLQPYDLQQKHYAENHLQNDF